MVIIENMAMEEKLVKEQEEKELMKISQACVSHEMKTPLKTIKIYSEYLLRNCNKEQEILIRSINVGSKLLLHNIESTLDLAKIQRDQFTRNDEEFCPRTLILEVVELERFSLEGKNIELIIELKGLKTNNSLISDRNRLA